MQRVGLGNRASIQSQVGVKVGMKKSSQATRQPTGDHAGGSDEILGPNSEIGRKLRAYYDELVSEEIPDRFSQLLRELETSEKPENGGKGAKPS